MPVLHDSLGANGISTTADLHAKHFQFSPLNGKIVVY
jgi:hypothetical protein